MNKYNLVRNNNYVFYKKNKEHKNKFKKIKLSCGIIFISIALITPKNLLNNIQSIYYNINESLNDNNDINNLDPNILKYFEQFENKLLDNIPYEYLNNYYNNISTLKYYNNPNDLNKLFNFKINAYYNSIANRIVCLSDTEMIKHVLFHELMHMASTNKYKSGFKTLTIGSGLDEGYTEYLIQKYFDNDFIAYSEEVKIIKILNQIIGENKMMKYYFTNDLDSLKHDLSNIYGTEKNAHELLLNIDKYNKSRNKDILNDITYSLMKYSYHFEKNNGNSEINPTLRIELYNLYDGDNFNKLEKKLKK